MQIHKAVKLTIFVMMLYCMFLADSAFFDDNLLMSWLFLRIVGDGY